MRETRYAAILAIALTVLTMGLVPAHAAPDFTVAANPTSFTDLYAGLGTNDTITVTSTGGFTGTVTLSATATTGIATSFSPGSVTLSSGGQATSTLTITPNADCNVGTGRTISVTGTSGSLFHKAYITWQYLVC